MTRFQRSFGLFVALSAFAVGLACSLGNFLPSFGPEVIATQAAVLPTLAVSLPTVGSTLPTVGANLPSSLPTLPSIATQPASATKAPSGGTADITGVQKGLDTLDSYSAVLKMTLKGKNAAGKEVTQEINLNQDVIKSASSQHFGMSGSGLSTSLGSGSFDIYQIGKTSYMQTTTNDKLGCLSFSSDKPAFDQSQLLTAEEMLGSISTESLIAKGETVNGVKADHYKVNRGDLMFGKVTSQSGEVWIAQNGGFLVKYSGKADGSFTISAEEVTGTITWAYDLTNPNQLKEITLPAACKEAGAAVSDLPIPANATDQGNLGELITFNSPDTPKVVGDYYRRELPGKGWKITSDTNVGAVVMMSISKDTRKFTIMISPGSNDKGSAVVITKTP